MIACHGRGHHLMRCSLLAVLLTTTGWGQTARTIMLHLPGSGRLAEVGPALTRELADSGLTVEDSTAQDPASLPAVVVLYSGETLSAEERSTLEGFVREGGGLVYLIGSTSRHVGPATELLEPLGFEVRSLGLKRGVVQLGAHPIVRGVIGLGAVPATAGLSGARLQTLAVLEGATVAAAGEVGKGRVVVLPEGMVASTGGPSPAQVQVLANACLWAAQLSTESPEGGPGDGADARPPAMMATPPSGSVTAGPSGPIINPPEDKRARPMATLLDRKRWSPSSDFSGTALVDIVAGDDNWGLIAETLDRTLTAAGLQVRYLDIRHETPPLVEALDSQPALLVIGSTRRFTIAEAVAVSHYARLGGRVLFLAHASARVAIRLVDLNLVLSEFGMTASLVRPQGPTLLGKHAITRGLMPPPQLPWGVGIWSAHADPVAKAGRVCFLAAVEDGPARIVALDAKLLLVGTPAVPSPVKTPEKQPFLPLFTRTVAWLLESR